MPERRSQQTRGASRYEVQLRALYWKVPAGVSSCYSRNERALEPGASPLPPGAGAQRWAGLQLAKLQLQRLPEAPQRMPSSPLQHGDASLRARRAVVELRPVVLQVVVEVETALRGSRSHRRKIQPPKQLPPACAWHRLASPFPALFL
eukprot:Hpha_TRINITY_DN16665_c0_g13::TRINITY_DN16665_c0_g13_i1::g.182227::m.182227